MYLELNVLHVLSWELIFPKDEKRKKRRRRISQLFNLNYRPKDGQW